MTLTTKLPRVRAALERVIEMDGKMTAGPWDSDTDDLATWINVVEHPQPIAKMGTCTHFPKADNATGIALYRNLTPAIARGMLLALDAFGAVIAAKGNSFYMDFSARQIDAILNCFPDDV